MMIPADNLRNLRRNNQVMFKALSQPCADCNIVWHPYVMSFDHTDRSTKFKNPSSIRTYSAEVFDAEIAKCEVVCLNCHQFREYLRDIGIIEISDKRKIDAHKYYQRLLPYMAGGAMIRRDAFKHVRVGGQ